MINYRYIVQKGDTLSEIAQKLTGSWKNYVMIAAINKIQNADKIYEGQELIIPIKRDSPLEFKKNTNRSTVDKTYRFFTKPVPESSAISPIPISFPIWEYQGADPDREIIPIQYAPESQTVRIETPEPQKLNTYNLKEARKTISKRKGSHQFKSKDIKVGNMHDFLDEAAKYGIYFRVTSGVREGAKTLNGNTSNHATGNAIDITPLDGQSWDELITQIKNTPELLDYMRKNKMRILDERSSEMLAKTGGTGAHFHLSFGKTEGKGVDEYFV